MNLIFKIRNIIARLRISRRSNWSFKQLNPGCDWTISEGEDCPCELCEMGRMLDCEDWD